MTGVNIEIQRLREENATLAERVRQLEEALVPPRMLPAGWPYLTVTEERLLRAIAERDIATHDHLYFALYGGHGQPPEPKIIAVLICKIRKKLAPVGVAIETVWGRGYRLDAATRQRLREGTQA